MASDHSQLIGPEVAYPTPWRMAEEREYGHVIACASGHQAASTFDPALGKLICDLVNASVSGSNGTQDTGDGQAVCCLRPEGHSGRHTNQVGWTEPESSSNAPNETAAEEEPAQQTGDWAPGDLVKYDAHGCVFTARLIKPNGGACWLSVVESFEGVHDPEGVFEVGESVSVVYGHSVKIESAGRPDTEPLHSGTENESQPTKPRVWRKGDPEPSPEVHAVRHTNSQVFTRRRVAVDVWQAGIGKPLTWSELTDRLGGYALTEVVSGSASTAEEER
jgi:hypothetical protein